MGFLTKLGDIAKGFVNEIPGVGMFTQAAFGEVGERGFVGRIGGGGISQAAQPTIGQGGFAPQLPAGLPSLPRFPGMSGGNGGSPSMPTQFNGNGTNGQFSDDVSTLLGGDRIVMEPGQKVINTAPPGWVVVDVPGHGKKAVRKEVARCLGLWKSRSKPPISASDWKKLKTAKRVENKAKKIAQTAGWKGLKK